MLELMKRIAENINPDDPACKNASVVIHFSTALPEEVRVSILNNDVILSREVATESLDSVLETLAQDAMQYRKGYQVGLEMGKKIVMNRMTEEVRDAA